MLHCRHIVKMLGPDVCVCFWLLMPVGMAMWGFMGSGDCVFFEGGSSSSLLFLTCRTAFDMCRTGRAAAPTCEAGVEFVEVYTTPAC